MVGKFFERKALEVAKDKKEENIKLETRKKEAVGNKTVGEMVF